MLVKKSSGSSRWCYRDGHDLEEEASVVLPQ
jgi:hypothetical protein